MYGGTRSAKIQPLFVPEAVQIQLVLGWPATSVSIYYINGLA